MDVCSMYIGSNCEAMLYAKMLIVDWKFVMKAWLHLNKYAMSTFKYKYVIYDVLGLTLEHKKLIKIIRKA